MTLEYVLVDLDVVREAGLIDAALKARREIVNPDEVTSFTWLTLDECARAGAIKDLLFTLDGWRISRPAPPTRVPMAKKSDDWLCTECRANVAMRDGMCGACWLTEWKKAQLSLA